MDGAKAEEINDLDTTFLGAYVPEGKHEVVLKYRNQYVRYGSIISIAGLILLLIVFIKTGKDLKKDPGQNTTAGE